MAKPKLFIGSSQKNLRVAKVLAEGLEDYAEARVWDEGVFGLNQGYLEVLLDKLEEYDFAVFILAADDVVISNDRTTPSPRDNVLFESGLFMGVLGPARVFLVHDQVVGLKIPSDLAGVTLASYDSTRIQGEDAAAAVRKACRLIGDSIAASRYPHLVGVWKSIYLKTDEEGQPLIEEEVEIRASRDGISIASKSGTREDDYYIAFGRVPQERQIIGEWKSRAESCDTSGTFILTVSPGAKFMYGYFTSPDENGGTVYASWVLAKQTNIDEDKADELLKTAQNMLRKTTIGLTSQPADS